MGIVKDSLDRLTGRSTEAKLEEYSEVYGEVLLGMHQDIEEYRAAVGRYEGVVSKALDEIRDAQRTLVERVDGAVGKSEARAAEAAAAARQAATESQRASATAKELRDVLETCRAEAARLEVTVALFTRRLMWTGAIVLGAAGVFVWIAGFRG